MKLLSWLSCLAPLALAAANPFILPAPANGFLTLEIGSGLALSLATWTGPSISIHTLASKTTVLASKEDVITIFKTENVRDETTILMRHAHMKYTCKHDTITWQDSYISVSLYNDKFIFFDADGCEPTQATHHDLEILQAAYNCVN